MSVVSCLRRSLTAALLCFVFLAAAPTAEAQRAEARIPGELIVRLAPEADIADLTEASRLAGEGLVAKRLLVPALNIWLVEYVEAARNDQAARLTLDAVRRTPSVQVAQFNHEVTLRDTQPDDTRFDDMWGLHNTGQSGGTVDADIDAPEAWDYLSGGISAHGDRVAVAIIDNGFDLDHPDLDFWTNTAEIPGNGIDDDSNGYIDDVNGWSAYTSSGNVGNAYHGTHVSGTAAGSGDNGLGTTGVNWDAQPVAIQGSSSQESTVIEAYGYALALRQQYDATDGAEGAFIVSTNSSFGVNFGDPDDYPIWCGFYDDLGAAGILSMGATMNINANVDTQDDVPTACSSDYMIAVTNTTRDDNKNSGAAYGLTTIDLGAPGTSVLSTNNSGGYGTSTGTSMATPHVAGAAAFLVSGMSGARLQEYKDNPAAVALDIRRALLDGTDNIGIQTVTGGRLNLLGSLLESFEDDDQSDVVASSTTLANLVLEGDHLYVPDGVTLTLTGSLTLRADNDGNPARLIVRGTVQGTVNQSITGGSEIILRPGGQNNLENGGGGSIDLTATATTPTTVAPGGSVSFDFSVANSTASAVSGDLYYTASPGGISGIIRSGSLAAGATVSGAYTQNVPAATPPGTYTYTLAIGSFPSRASTPGLGMRVATTVSFTITVTGSATGGDEEWTVSNVVLEDEETVASSRTAPAGLALTAYPNPFAGSTMIQVSLAEAAEVQLVVYDVLGREVARLASGEMDAGQHTVIFNGRGLPSGAYVVRVAAGGAVQTQRLTLLR